ncbi:MAG TPA: DUF3108 domain-containing protein [Alphaproteobacteria bacterium]|nr:DUF3108 domain-containing protein [Alphaproteobacteria bacterium]
MLRQSNLLAVFAVLFLTAAPFSVAKAADKNPDRQKVRYDVYAGGIHALQANLDIDQSKQGRYSLSLDAKTYGLLGKLAPWEGVFESHGWAGKVNKPELHQSTAIWRGEKEIKKYKYNKDGSFAGYSVLDDENDGSLRDVDTELTKGTSDVLTATLNTMEAIAAGSDCEGETDIFDGSRRYTLIFRHKENVELEASRWNVYKGPAVQCTVEVKPGGGKWHEKPRGWMSIQEQGRERGTMPTVWFAKMVEGEPAVPVKVRVKTSYGTLFMHMTDYEGGKKKLTLAE